MTTLEEYGEREGIIEQEELRRQEEELRKQQEDVQTENINKWLEESIKYFMTEDIDMKIRDIDSMNESGTKEALEKLGVCCLQGMKNSNLVLFTFNSKEIPGNLKSPVPEENNKNSAVYLLESWVNQINLGQISKQIIGLRIEKGVDVDMNKVEKNAINAIKEIKRKLRHNGETLLKYMNHPFMTVIGDKGIPSSIVFSLPVSLSADGRIRYILYNGKKSNRK